MCVFFGAVIGFPLESEMKKGKLGLKKGLMMGNVYKVVKRVKWISCMCIAGYFIVFSLLCKLVFVFLVWKKKSLTKEYYWSKACLCV